MNTAIKLFGYRFDIQQFLLLLFGFLLMEDMFSWIFLRNSLLVLGYQKVFSLLVYAWLLYSFNRLRTGEQGIVVLFTLMMLRLVFESLSEYNSFFRQFTMFTVLYPVLFVVFTKIVFRQLGMDILGFVAQFYVITYILFMLLFGWGFSFSLDSVEMTDYGPFSGDSRILHASHVYMMIIPLLWYLNRFIQSRRNYYLLPVVFCFVVIFVHQHRSVWSAALISTAVYLFAMVRNRYLRISRLGSFAGVSIAMLIIGWFALSSLVPGFTDFFADRFSEIFNPAREGSTGNFRIEQREVYGAMFLQRPVFGWTFQGFEMSNPLVDWWPEMTGQHFHDGYMEMLFYLGIAGCALKYGFLIYLLFKLFSRRLTEPSIILAAFCVSGLLFSFNYVLPLVFWGIVGLCLFYLEETVPDSAIPAGQEYVDYIETK